jgi:indole-3-glycerol phosphate synthase
MPLARFRGGAPLRWRFMSTYLSAIVASHRAAAAGDHRDLPRLIEEAQRSPAPVPFAKALRRSPGHGMGDEEGHGLRVIAEVKRRSPSKGDLAPDLDPATLAADYRRGGASCLSVLTDVEYFGGSPDDLAAATRASGLPVLRKDFTVAAADVCDARLMGAGAVLLIVAALDQHELTEFAALSASLGLDALVEVHDEAELDRALVVGARLIGVNQRDLVTFEVDTRRAERLAALIPDDVVAVAESGVADAHDAARLADAGYDAVLVGETLVRSGDPAATTAALCGHPVGRRRGAGAGSVSTGSAGGVGS